MRKHRGKTGETPAENIETLGETCINTMENIRKRLRNKKI